MKETYYYDETGYQHFRGYYTLGGKVLMDELGRYPIRGFVEMHSFEHLNMEVYTKLGGDEFNRDALGAYIGEGQSFVRGSDEIYSSIAELGELNY